MRQASKRIPESAEKTVTDPGQEITELTLQSQAGWVLVSAAVLADSLERLLLIKMRTLSNKKAKQIFKNGPLRNLAAKIDIAWGFELIDDPRTS
jgi:hypothetical protein